MECKICGKEILMDADGKWDGLHNAEPIAEGRCCEKCNDTVVVPMRLREFQSRRENANT